MLSWCTCQCCVTIKHGIIFIQPFFDMRWVWMCVSAHQRSLSKLYSQICICRLSWPMDWRMTRMLSLSNDSRIWSGCCINSWMTPLWMACSLGSWWRLCCAPAITASLSVCRPLTCFLCPWQHLAQSQAWCYWKTASLLSATLRTWSTPHLALLGIQAALCKARWATLLLLLRWELHRRDLWLGTVLSLLFRAFRCSLLWVRYQQFHPLWDSLTLSMILLRATVCSKLQHLSETPARLEQLAPVMSNEGVCWASFQNASSSSWCDSSTTCSKVVLQSCVHLSAFGWRDSICRNSCVTRWCSVKTWPVLQDMEPPTCMICMDSVFIWVLTVHTMAITSATP